MPAFAEHLRALLVERRLSGRAFAQLVGANQSYVSKVLRGTRPPPDVLLERWAVALNLGPADLRRFLLLGDLEHVPPRLVPLVYRLTQLAQSRRPRLAEVGDWDGEDAGAVLCRLADELDLQLPANGSRRSKPHQ